ATAKMEPSRNGRCSLPPEPSCFRQIYALPELGAPDRGSWHAALQTRRPLLLNECGPSSLVLAKPISLPQMHKDRIGFVSGVGPVPHASARDEPQVETFIMRERCIPGGACKPILTESEYDKKVVDCVQPGCA